MYYSLFILLSVDGHLGCFYPLAIMNNAAMDFHLQGIVWMRFHFSRVHTYEWNCRVRWSLKVTLLRNSHTVIPRDCTSLRSQTKGFRFFLLGILTYSRHTPGRIRLFHFSTSFQKIQKQQVKYGHLKAGVHMRRLTKPLGRRVLMTGIQRQAKEDLRFQRIYSSGEI